ncbi:MAG: hypothetical protein QXW10_01060 [Candidatus Micrarchaeaceae archaeon]
MPQQRIRSVAKKPSSKYKTKDIQCRMNMLPIKALLYALTYALSKAEKNDAVKADGHMSKAKRSAKVLGNVLIMLKAGRQIEPGDLYYIISAATSSYVALCQNLDTKVQESILAEYDAPKGRWKRPEKESNLLTLPILAQKRSEPINKTVSGIKIGLYKKPFGFLYSCLEASKRLEVMQRSIAIKNMNAEDFSALSKSMYDVSKKIRGIEQGILKPEEDEAIKTEVLERLGKFSGNSGMHPLGFIEWKLDEDSLNARTAKRIIRL